MKNTGPLTTSAAIRSVSGGASAQIISQLNPLEVVREYVRWLTVAETEQTERERIRARRDVAVLAIESEREVLKDYFEKRFDERRAVLDEMFGLLRHSVATKNDASLDAALRCIVQVVGDNPLQDLDTFHKARAEGLLLEF